MNRELHSSCEFFLRIHAICSRNQSFFAVSGHISERAWGLNGQECDENNAQLWPVINGEKHKAGSVDLIVIQVYMPTFAYTDEDIDKIYDEMEELMNAETEKLERRSWWRKWCKRGS